jgi:YggT family protein
MHAIGTLLLFCLDVYFWIIIAGVVLSWLIAFEVVNVRNPQAANLTQLINRATDPVYKKLRKFIPPISGIDLTPMVVIFGIIIAKSLVAKMFMGPVIY